MCVSVYICACVCVADGATAALGHKAERKDEINKTKKEKKNSWKKKREKEKMWIREGTRGERRRKTSGLNEGRLQFKYTCNFTL